MWLLLPRGKEACKNHYSRRSVDQLLQGHRKAGGMVVERGWRLTREHPQRGPGVGIPGRGARAASVPQEGGDRPGQHVHGQQL